MEAKDTVMSDAELMSWHLRPLECRRAIALAQAEITASVFSEEGRKAGIREVVKWIQYHLPDYEFGDEWQAFLKEKGIE